MSDLGAIFSKPKVNIPDPRPSAPMPDVDDPAVQEAGRRRRREAQESGGRASTGLSGAPVTYANPTLGS